MSEKWKKGAYQDLAQELTALVHQIEEALAKRYPVRAEIPLFPDREFPMLSFRRKGSDGWGLAVMQNETVWVETSSIPLVERRQLVHRLPVLVEALDAAVAEASGQLSDSVREARAFLETLKSPE